MKRFLLVLLLLCQEDKLGVTAKEFEERRARLMERIKDGVGALDAGPITSDAAAYDFLYLVNYHEEGAVLVLSPGERKCALFVKDVKTAAEKSGIKDVRSLDSFEEFAAGFFPKAAKVYTKLRKVPLEIVKKHAAKVEGGVIGPELARLRVMKSKMEQDLTRRSVEISCGAHVRTMKALTTLENERDVQKIYEEEFKKNGATPGYGYICGSGPNGCILHYGKNDQPLPRDSLIVCDCGTNYKGYVADVTRTFPTSGKFTKEQRAKYQLVLDAQKAAEAKLRPGATWSDLTQAAKKVFEDAGQTKWSYAHSKDRQVMHGLGHWVGLYVHDSGIYSAKFEPGMVITIEPGWYDKDQGWGIRIEDMYLVTEGGFDRLSKGAPREIDEIEKAMAEK